MRVDVATLLGNGCPEPSWLVDGIFPTGQTIVLAGEAGVGKSYFSYALALAVCGAGRFLGRQTAPGRALVFDEENSLPDLSSYLYALWTGYGLPDLDPIAPALQIEHFSMTGALKDDATTMMMIAKAHRPTLIVIDTLGAVLAVRDENDNAEAARHFRILQHVRNQADPACTMLILKHARVDRKTGHKDIRGAKDWKGKADGVYFLGKARGRPRIDGLNQTVLEPLKVRAFGLRNRGILTPRKIPQGGVVLDFSEIGASTDSSDD